MNSLSPKKQKFLDFIRDFQARKNSTPTFQEIMAGLKIKSLGTINWYVRELEQDGFLERAKANGKRALRLVENELMTNLPLLGSIRAGNPLEQVEIPERIEVPPSFLKSDNYVLQVNGDSMIEDNIQDGDFVIIRKQTTANTGETIVAIVNGEATLKRYYPENPNIRLQPRNDNYEPIIVTPNDNFEIRGVVLFVFREY